VAAAAQAAAAAAGVTPGAGGRAGPSVPEDHPLRKFKELADDSIAQVGTDIEPGPSSGAAFATLVKASLLMGLYSFQHDRVFLDQLRYNALLQWFLDLAPAEAAFDADAFASDREQAMESRLARRVFDRLVPRAGRAKLFSSPLLQVNGNRIKGWMSSQRAGA
jgi:transposase